MPSVPAATTRDAPEPVRLSDASAAGTGAWTTQPELTAAVLTLATGGRVVLAVPWAGLPRIPAIPEHAREQRALARALARAARARPGVGRHVPVVLSVADARAVVESAARYPCAERVAGLLGAPRLTPIVSEHLRTGRVVLVLDGVGDVDAEGRLLERHDAERLLALLDDEQVRLAVLVARGCSGWGSPVTARGDVLDRHGFGRVWLRRPTGPAHPLVAHLRAVLTDGDHAYIRRLHAHHASLATADSDELLRVVTAHLTSDDPLGESPLRVPLTVRLADGRELSERQLWDALRDGAPAGIVLDGVDAPVGIGTSTLLLTLAARAWCAWLPAVSLDLSELTGWPRADGSLARQVVHAAWSTGGIDASRDPARDELIDVMPLVVLLDDLGRCGEAGSVRFAMLRKPLIEALRGRDAGARVVVASDGVGDGLPGGVALDDMRPAAQLHVALERSGAWHDVMRGRIATVAPKTRDAVLERAHPRLARLIQQRVSAQAMATPRALRAIADTSTAVLARHLNISELDAGDEGRAEHGRARDVDPNTFLIESELERLAHGDNAGELSRRPEARDVMLRLLESLALAMEQRRAWLTEEEAGEAVWQALQQADAQQFERDVDAYVARHAPGDSGVRRIVRDILREDRGRQLEPRLPAILDELERACSLFWRGQDGRYRMSDSSLVTTLALWGLRRTRRERREDLSALLYALAGTEALRRYRADELPPCGPNRPHPYALRAYTPTRAAEWLACMLARDMAADRELIEAAADSLALMDGRRFREILESADGARVPSRGEMWWVALAAGARECLSSDTACEWIVDVLDEASRSDDVQNVGWALAVMKACGAELATVAADWYVAVLGDLAARPEAALRAQAYAALRGGAATLARAGAARGEVRGLVDGGMGDTDAAVRAEAFSVVAEVATDGGGDPDWFRAALERAIEDDATTHFDLHLALRRAAPWLTRDAGDWLWRCITRLIDRAPPGDAPTEDTVDLIAIIADMSGGTPPEDLRAVLARAARDGEGDS